MQVSGRTRVRVWGPPLLVALSFYILLAIGSTLEEPPHFVSRLSELRPPFTFVLYGDTREGQEPWRPYDSNDRRRIVDRILEGSPRFIVNSGDLIGSGGERASWARFDGLMSQVRARGIPYFPALGNHEYHDFGNSALRNYFDRFPDLGGRKWYEFRAGPLRFIVLDANNAELAPAEIAAQADFLRNTLASAESDPATKLVIFVYHYPAFTNCRVHGPSHWSRVNIVDVAAGLKKRQLHLTGHVHSYERFELDGGRIYVVSGGGGAPLMAVDDDPQEIRTRPAFEGPAERWHHFLKVDALDDSARFEVVALKPEGWAIIDRFEIKF